MQMSAREAERLAKRERRAEEKRSRILLRLLIPLLVVAIVHVTLAIHVRGLIVVGISTCIGLWLLPRIERAIRRWWRDRSVQL